LIVSFYLELILVTSVDFDFSKNSIETTENQEKYDFDSILHYQASYLK